MKNILLSLILIIHAAVLPANHSHLTSSTAATLSEDIRLFISSNTQSNIGVVDMSGADLLFSNISTVATDADGIYYDQPNDVLYQLNRADNVINAYSNVQDALSMGTDPVLTASSSSDFINGREIAFFDGKLIVAQDANDDNGNINKFVVYNASAQEIILDRIFDVDVNLWGIHSYGNTLFAIEDNSDRLLRYDNFFDNSSGPIEADASITIENMVRTHGLTYDANEDLMILTDVAEASNASDGAIVVIRNFTNAASDDMISAMEQVRISGGSSLLGNPVDVAYDNCGKNIFVAERANGGGRVLGFSLPTLTGGKLPFYDAPFPGASAINLGIAGDFCNLVKGGAVSFLAGGRERTIFVDDFDDFLSFKSTIDPVASGHKFTYVVTDSERNILGIPPGNTVNFNPAGLGACLVYGLSYTGELTIAMGDALMEGPQSDGCNELSSNFLTVNRIAPEPAVSKFFVSSNTQPTVAAFSILSDGNKIMKSLDVEAADADGIYYDEEGDVLYQLNRTDNVINAYTNVKNAIDTDASLTLSATSSSDFVNGREIAFSNGKIVVAQDANDANGNTNKLLVYNASATSITLEKEFIVDINLWGIFPNGSTLVAIEDNSNRIAMYEDFFDNASGDLEVSSMVSVEGLVRTHGLTYDTDSDVMILTDVGAASSASDGALVIASDFMANSADGMISSSEQIRVSGGGSKLGNPVDVALDTDNNIIYVAERANGGGRVLGFNFPRFTGGATPVLDQLFPGASAIHLPGLDVGTCDFVNGGKVSFQAGGTERTIFIDDKDDLLNFSSTIDAASADFSFTYVVTDADGMILGIPPGNMVDFNPAGLGACLVYGLSYTGELNIEMGDDLMAGPISDDCFELSSNFLTVNRIEPQDIISNFFVSSNTQPIVAAYSILDDGTRVMNTLDVEATDADGIYYDESADVLYQLNRADNVINAYSDVQNSLSTGSPLNLTATSTSDFINGREIAFTSGKLVVAQDANDANGNVNKLYVYDASPTSITLEKEFTVDINLWGIFANGSTLVAVEDNSNRVAMFNNFFDNASGNIAPSSIVSVDGLVRTHGLTYNTESDMMILTDVGAASSASDGALVVVRNFTTAADDSTISSTEQVRVSGGSSLLGNPVDVALDKTNKIIYVAERANGGGRILGFGIPRLSGGIAPIFNQTFAGAAGIHLPGVDVGLCDFVKGGLVALGSGGTETTIIIDDADDFISFTSTVDAVAEGHNFTYVVTDADGMILGIPPGSMVNFNPAGLGACLVYGLSYTGDLNIEMGDDLMAGPISDDCFSLSSNFLTVNRIEPQEITERFFVSSNTQGVAAVISSLADGKQVMNMFAVEGMDADGIYYDESADVLYQLNRSDNVINAYSNVEATIMNGTMPQLTATSSSDFTNGRELAFANGKIVVAQDANDANGNTNKFYVYDASPTSITLENTYDADINLWGIHIDGSSLLAVEDNSNRVALYNNFFDNNDGDISADVVVSVDDLIRTHGITYDASEDLLILTDVGEASKAGDGALVVIKNFTTASTDGIITASEQVRVAGGTSRLGNPVDVAYDKENRMVYVAERANGGGRILGYNMPRLSGGIAPVYNKLFAGASAIYFQGADADGLVEGIATNRSSDFKSSQVELTQVYPVPAVNELNLVIESPEDITSTLYIYDVRGSLMNTINVNLVKGSNTIQIDISELGSGQHFMSDPVIGLATKFIKYF